MFLYIGTRFPERVPHIPSVEVGKGEFNREFSNTFWEGILGDTTNLIRHAEKNTELLKENEIVIESPENSNKDDNDEYIDIEEI